MADDKVRFDLVSPERRLASEEVDMVVLPGEDGDFGVLPLHAPLVSLLRPGVITTYAGDRPDKRIFVGGGFAEVNERGCIVLAEDAEPLEEVTRAGAERALEDARAGLGLAAAENEAERDRLEGRVRAAEARLEALAAAGVA